MNKCDKCLQKGKDNCKHLIGKCKLCDRKSIKDGYCSTHIPKKIVTKQIPDPKINEERMRRINLMMEQQRYRDEMIEREYFRIRDTSAYGDKAELDDFILRVNRERQEEEERLNHEFEETMRFFNNMRPEATHNKMKGNRSKYTKEKPKHDENPKRPRERYHSNGEEETNERPKSLRTGEFESLFVFIEIEPTRDVITIRKAYKIAAIKLHPDKCSAPDAHEKFIEMSNAYNRILEILNR